MPITDDQAIAVPPPQEGMPAPSAPTSTPASTSTPLPIDTPTPPPSFLDPDSVLIHYETSGERYPIVLVHGFIGSIQGDWVDTGLVDALTSAGHQVIALDNRGNDQDGGTQPLCSRQPSC